MVVKFNEYAFVIDAQECWNASPTQLASVMYHCLYLFCVFYNKSSVWSRGLSCDHVWVLNSPIIVGISPWNFHGAGQCSGEFILHRSLYSALLWWRLGCANIYIAVNGIIWFHRKRYLYSLGGDVIEYLLWLHWRLHEYLFFKMTVIHDDVIKWNICRVTGPFVRGIHRSPVNSPHEGQWRGDLIISLIYAWIIIKVIMVMMIMMMIMIMMMMIIIVTIIINRRAMPISMVMIFYGKNSWIISSFKMNDSVFISHHICLFRNSLFVLLDKRNLLPLWSILKSNKHSFLDKLVSSTN